MNSPLDRIYQRLLVLRCQTGDAAAFEELVGQYNPRLRRFVAGLLSDAHAVDDVLQDAWLDVWRTIGRLRDPGALEAWLFRIARDRAYRVLRRKRAIVPALPLESAEIAVEPKDESLDADEQRLIATSLTRLGHEHREVLLLRFVDQLTYDQIATAVGCEVGTVRSRLHYAKKALSRLLKGSET